MKAQKKSPNAPKKKKTTELEYKHKIETETLIQIQRPIYPQPVKIGETKLEFHMLPTSDEIAKLTEKNRIKILGSVVTPAAHNTLNHFISDKKWFSGVIIAASFLEFFGKTRLLWKYENVISKKKILDMNLEDVITSLFISKIIDQSTYTKMEEIRRARNKTVHHLDVAYELILQKSKGIKKAETIIKKAHECLDILAPSTDTTS